VVKLFPKIMILWLGYGRCHVLFFIGIALKNQLKENKFSDDGDVLLFENANKYCEQYVAAADQYTVDSFIFYFLLIITMYLWDMDSIQTCAIAQRVI
jgi:hypothetical protein